MMTKKNYEMIAKILKENIDNNSTCATTLAVMAYELAIYFKMDNPKFDSMKFATACGIK
jgi:hypothetical protein